MKNNIIKNFNCNRKFGIELEFNRPCEKKLEKIIKNNSKEKTESHSYITNEDNNYWCCKTDSSCGYEIASAVMNGQKDMYKIKKILEALKRENVIYNNKCGLHIHINISDFNNKNITNTILWWIKSEHIFFSMLPKHRRINEYCYPINLYLNQEKINQKKIDFFLCERNGINGSNVRLHKNNSRFEFRILPMSLNYWYIKKWIMLFMLFLEKSKKLPKPKDVFWLELNNFLKIMDLNKKNICPSMKKIKNHILDLIIQYKDINLQYTIESAKKIKYK